MWEWEQLPENEMEPQLSRSLWNKRSHLRKHRRKIRGIEGTSGIWGLRCWVSRAYLELWLTQQRVPESLLYLAVRWALGANSIRWEQRVEAADVDKVKLMLSEATAMKHLHEIIPDVSLPFIHFSVSFWWNEACSDNVKCLFWDKCSESYNFENSFVKLIYIMDCF